MAYSHIFGPLSTPVPLSYLDDNFNQAAQLTTLAASGGAALVGFLPSGTGGVSRTVSSALAAMVRSGDYDTAGHFNTAQSVLTESVGAFAVRLGTGGASEHQIVMPSQGEAPFAILVGGGTYNGTVDPTFAYGYNPDSTTNVPILGLNMEGNYNDGSGQNKMEMNLDYTSPDHSTAVGKRFYAFQVNRSTHKASFQWAAQDGFKFTDLINGTPALSITANGLAIGTTVTIGRCFEITGPRNTATTEYVIDGNITAGSGVTNFLGIFVSEPSTTAAAFTLPTINHFVALDGTKGAGSAITTNIGFRAVSLANGATNIGFSGELAAGSNVWNLSMTGTAQNLLQGVTGIGIAASSTAALALAAGTTGVASLRVPHGSAPTSPVNGDMWTTTSGLFVRINGSTVGPLT